MAYFSIVATVLVALLLPAKSLFSGDSCWHEEQAGTCTTLVKCKPLYDEVQRAGRPMPMSIRMKLQALGCGFDKTEPLVCCTVSSPLITGSVEESSDWGSVLTQPTIRPTPSAATGTETRSGMLPNVENHPNLRLLPIDDCGVVDVDRIFGGKRAAMYELPWMVLLSYSTGRGTKLSCGGSLISDRYVLTAAHCVSFLGNRMKLNGVILGEHDVRKDPDCERVDKNLSCAPNVRNVTIEEVIAHKGYTPQTLVDDIALLRLSEPADFTLASMKPVCLPVTNELQTQFMEGMNGRVSGWGATENGLQSPVLLSVELPIVPNKECQNAYNGSPKIHDWQLCAGGVPDEDSCGGDSGGPLTFPGNLGNKGERVVQRGIVSYGSKRCGIGGLPGVYTRIAYYMDWILDRLRD